MNTRFILILYLLISQGLIACRQIEIGRSTSQQVSITDFSTTQTFILDATKDGFVNSFRFTVNGTLSNDVVCFINRRDEAGRWVAVQSLSPIRLAKGTYTNKPYGGDHYGSDALQLMVVPSAGTTGFLSIEWALQ